MPFSAPIVTSGKKTFDDGDDVSIALPRSAPAAVHMLEMELDYTIAAGDKTAHEDGWGALIKRLTLQPSGGRPPLKVDGYGAIVHSEMGARNELSPAPTLPVTGGASHTARLTLPIFPNLKGFSDDPFESHYNPRGLSDWDLELDMRALSDVLTSGGALSAIAGRAWVTTWLRTDLAARNPLLAAPFFSRSVLPISGASQGTLGLRIGGAISHLLLVARDGPALSDSRSDTVIDTISLRLNDSTDLVQSYRWRVARQAASMFPAVPFDTGVGLIDFSTIHELNNSTLVAAGGAQVQSLNLDVETTASADLSVYPLTLKV